MSSFPTTIWLNVGTAYRAWSLANSGIALLQLSKAELQRFRKKVINLSLCYLAFRCNESKEQSQRSAEAGFCSAIYDVLTDWRGLSLRNRATMETILSKYAEPSAVAIAVDLYDKEMTSSLADDGLERGVDALAFIVALFGSSERLSRDFDLVRLGSALQVVDDVLDLESDRQEGELNCLQSNRRSEYLDLMFNELNESRLQLLCNGAPVFCLAVNKALQLGRQMLRDPQASGLSAV